MQEEPVVSETSTVENETTPIENGEQPETSEVKQSEPHPFEKRLADKEKYIGKLTNEVGDLRKFRKQVESYFNSITEQKRNQDLQSRYSQDPLQAVKDLLEQKMQEKLQPYEQQQSVFQAKEIDGRMKEVLGQEYETHAPVMAEVLADVARADDERGTNYARVLAENPDFLLGRALLEGFIRNRNGQRAQSQQAEANKSRQLNNMTQIAKGNSTASRTAPGEMGSMNLNEMETFLRQKGILKKAGD